MAQDNPEHNPKRDGLSKARWSWASMGLVALILIFYCAGIATYMFGLGPDRYASIEGTRPILVFTLIVAMLGFGGLLIVRALFVSEPDDKFQNRFRNAREVFLVFAGIFGTIIGFYFGAADEESANSPKLEVAFAGGLITAVVAEGEGPFIGIFTPKDGGGGSLMTAANRLLTYSPPGGTCPKGGKVRVIDGRGKQAEAEVACTAAGQGPDTGNGATPAGGNAADTNAAEANAA